MSTEASVGNELFPRKVYGSRKQPVCETVEIAFSADQLSTLKFRVVPYLDHAIAVVYRILAPLLRGRYQEWGSSLGLRAHSQGNHLRCKTSLM